MLKESSFWESGISVNICKPSKSIGSKPALKHSSADENKSFVSKEPDMLAIADPKSFAKSWFRNRGSSEFGPEKRLNK